MVAKFLSVSIVVALASLNGASAFHINTNTNVRPTETTLDAMSRREAMATSAASAATLLVARTPLAANAAGNVADCDIAAAYCFNGVFKDPKHPSGYRIIAGGTTKEGSLTMQDDPESEVFTIPVKSQKNEETGEITLNIDFSVKGGPSNLVATVNKDKSISFPDGNKWQKVKGVAGVYIDSFAPYPKYRRVIRLDGQGIVVDMVSGKKTFEVAGNVAGKKILVEFPGNKNCKGTIDIKKGTIAWPDGNVWTKV